MHANVISAAVGCYITGIIATFVLVAMIDGERNAWTEKYNDGELIAIIAFWPAFLVKFVLWAIGTLVINFFKALFK